MNKPAVFRSCTVTLFCLLFLTSFYGNESGAVSTQICIHSATSGFETGRKSNTSITPRGITLSPEVVRIEGISEPYVWAMASDSQGRIYVGTGDPGSVYKLEPQAAATPASIYKPQLLFRSTELHVHTLAVSPSGEIYAGTSPQGHIYCVSPNGGGKLFCDLPCNYVWKLAFDIRGNLYAATGPEGIIYRINAEGKADVFFDSSETLLLDLVSDKESSLYACSEPNGIVYKINPQGQAFVLYDAEEEEVHCLAMDSLGQLYAGTASGGRPRIPTFPSVPVPPPPKLPPTPAEAAPSPVDTPLQEPPPAPPVPETPRPREAERPVAPPYQPKIINFIYRIAPNGTVRKVLEVPQALVLCMAVDAKDNVLVGTGSEARIYRMDSKGESCNLLDVEEAQVLCLVWVGATLTVAQEGSASGGQDLPLQGFFFGTGNTGRVFLASNNYTQEGSFESEIFDAKFITSWGNLSWEGNAPEGTRITLSTRTGNSKRPDNTWSPWSEEYTQAGKIQSPASRFIQYRARLTTTRPQETPLLQRVSFAYLPQNQAPEITSLSVGPSAGPKERFPRLAPGRGMEPPKEPGFPPPSPPGAVGRETKSISWKTTDPNGDSMRYQLFYKGRNERDWKPITREEIKGESYNWQTTRVPDGEYLVKLIVSDEPNNPPSIALSTEKVSEPFLVDNTRPLLLNLKATGNTGRIEVSGLARDELSNIGKVEYSVDAGDWRAIFPKDNIFDSKEEDFQFVVEALSPGEHTIVINATDAEGNIGSGKIVFELR